MLMQPTPKRSAGDIFYRRRLFVFLLPLKFMRLASGKFIRQSYCDGKKRLHRQPSAFHPTHQADRHRPPHTANEVKRSQRARRKQAHNCTRVRPALSGQLLSLLPTDRVCRPEGLAGLHPHYTLRGRLRLRSQTSTPQWRMKMAQRIDVLKTLVLVTEEAEAARCRRAVKVAEFAGLRGY